MENYKKKVLPYKRKHLIFTLKKKDFDFFFKKSDKMGMWLENKR
jgi:hypothetical protein